jgi:rhamnose transport system permease protein
MARYQREVSVAIVLALLMVVLAAAAPSFYRGAELRNLVVSGAPMLVAAVGMSLVILARQIDISIGSQLSICGVTAGLLAKTGLPMPLVALVVMIMGAGLGAVNGVFVGLLGLPSIIVTLATMVIYGQALLWWRGGEFVKYLPADFQWFGFGQLTGQAIIVGVAATTFLMFAWGLRYLAAGRAIYAVGSDSEAAFLVGVRPRRVLLAAFAILGALTGLAALLTTVQFPEVDPSAGKGMELQVIAAVVVGGVAISGGRGTLVGVLFGVALLSTIDPALVFFRIEASWGKVFDGAIILIAVASDALNFQRRKHGLGAHTA